MTVGPDLLKAAEANDQAAIDMVSIWGLGFRADWVEAWRRDCGCMAAAQSVLQRCQPGVLFRDLSACNSYQNALARSRASEGANHIRARRTGHDDAGKRPARRWQPRFPTRAS